MKRILLAMVMFFGLVSVSYGAPFLACDWQDGVVACEVEVNGVVVQGTVVQQGGDMILLDLAGYDVGLYTFKARFIGTGGWPSDWSVPFSASKPSGIGSILRIKR